MCFILLENIIHHFTKRKRRAKTPSNVYHLANKAVSSEKIWRLQAEEERSKKEAVLEGAVHNLLMNTNYGPKDKSQFSAQLKKAYKELFDLFDCNGDGSISVHELGHVFRVHLGKALPETELSKIIEQVDENHSKTIEFEEFLTLMASETWSEIEKSEIIKAFAVFDRNKDGSVDAAELKYALATYGESLSQDEIDELFSLVDLDKNGVIDYSEFETMMCADEGVLDCRQQ